MEAFLIYSIQTALCIVLFYTLYKSILIKDTHFRFNQQLIGLMLILSCIIPLSKILFRQSILVEKFTITLPTYLASPDALLTHESTFPWLKLLIGIYLIGFIITLGKISLGYIQIIRIIQTSHRYTQTTSESNQQTIRTSKKIKHPFSWMHYIIIPQNIIEEKCTNQELSLIIQHERTHCTLHHSQALLIYNIILLFQWFNPAVWLFRKELKTLQEYQVDEQVIQQTKLNKTYQHLLIKQTVGIHKYTLANSINYSSTKKRINMMLQKKSNPWNRAKALIIAPIAFLALTLIAMPSIASNSTTNQEEPVLQMATQMPEFPGGEQALINFLGENIHYPEKAQKEGIQGTVIVEFTITKLGKVKDAKIARSISPELDQEALRVVNSMPNWKPGKNKHQPVNVGYNLPIRFSLQ